jgi:hypothetical protein
VEALGRMLGDAGEHVSEPGLRVDVVQLAVTIRVYMRAAL